jgi:hypothetical protein
MSSPENTPPSDGRWGGMSALRDRYTGRGSVWPVLLGILIPFAVLALLFLLPGHSLQ